MAKTENGTEFHLVQISPISTKLDLALVKETIRSVVRTGDALFIKGNALFLAFPGPVPDVGKAVRRVLGLVRERNLPVRTRLLAEPFEGAVGEVATLVKNGDIPLNSRTFIKAKAHDHWMD